MNTDEATRQLSRSEDFKNTLIEIDTLLKGFKERNQGKFESAKKCDLVYLNQLIEEKLAEALQIKNN